MLKKLVPPSTRVTCLGIVVDTVEFSTSIPVEKLQIIKNMCNQWSDKSISTKKNYNHCWVHCYMQERKIIKITKEFKQDLNWFRKFLVVYNMVFLSSIVLQVNLLT